MNKYIPYNITCPLASCSRSNTCARYANYQKAKAEEASFMVLNTDLLQVEGEGLSLPSCFRTSALGKRFQPSLQIHPIGQCQISERIYAIHPAPFLQGKEWRVSSQSSDAGRTPGDFQGKRCRPQSGVRQLRGAGCAGREVVSFEPPGRLAGDFLF